MTLCNVNHKLFIFALAIILLVSHTVFAEYPRCLCLRTTKGIHPKHIKTVEIKEPRSECNKMEIIAHLKNGVEVCLDPESAMGKKLIEKSQKQYEQ
ncbi:Ja158.2 [Japanese cytomegalovirus]|nr:Ja158.2 [Japanese cytomegalovirus]